MVGGRSKLSKPSRQGLIGSPWASPVRPNWGHWRAQDAGSAPAPLDPVEQAQGRHLQHQTWSGSKRARASRVAAVEKPNRHHHRRDDDPRGYAIALGQSGKPMDLVGVSRELCTGRRAVFGTHSETNVQHDGYGQVRNINSVHFHAGATPA